MAEFKNVFIKSKMNKDLDDRLLPQGEYRNAVNIQVSKSESEDVGALENVLGNKKIIDFETVTGNSNLVCIGYLVSEVNSCVFFFLTDNKLSTNQSGKYEKSAENFIIKSTISSGVAISNIILVEGAFLNFYEGSPIYGVNLLENLLFWTDNRNQPRKINVDLAEDTSGYYNIEDTISVAKYMPYTSPLLWQESTVAPGSYETTMKDVVSEFLPDGTTPNPYLDTQYQGDPDYLEDKFVRFGYRFKFEDGEYSVFSPFTQETFIPQQDGFFLFNPSGSDNDDNDMSAAYRSTIVDFMENKVNQLTLLIQMPENQDPAFAATTLQNTTDYFKITELEILYKESDGVAVLVVDTVSADQIKEQYDAADPSNTYLYTYSGTKPFKTLPESQLVRVYDKVPVKALGQEIISNRVVYSNFQTRHTPPVGIDYNVGAGPKLPFDVTTPLTPVSWNTSIVEYPNSTLKQNRNYQAGFVLSDRFGRTTSTILSNAATTTGATAGQLSTVYSPYNPPIVDIGNWPGDSLFVQVNEPINESPVQSDLYPGTYKGDPSKDEYNPLGFYSWKVVVKQQEQDYYNVYLPGILASYPDDPTKELGLTSHVVLLNDNINKVPRDLSEVGPDQKQFRSSVQLFGRVENTDQIPTGTPATDFGVVNQQYYPSRFSDTVSTISTEFELFNIDQTVTPFPNDFSDSFYEAESNPLIGRISTTNQIGQIVPTPPPPTYSIFNLAVYETEPTESRLDIYWETSTSGRIDELNEQVEATGGQTIFSTQNFNFFFNEYWGIYDPIAPWDPAVQGSPEPGGAPATPPIPDNGELGRYRSVTCGPFWFEDTTTTEIQNVTVVNFSITDFNGINVTSDFDLLQIKGTGSTPPGPGNYIDYTGSATTSYAWDTFIIVNKSYRLFSTNTAADIDSQKFNIVLTVSDDDSIVTPPPQKVFTYTPLANATVLSNLPAIIVGGESFSTVPQQWGQNPSATVPAPPILDYAKVCPPSQVVVDYGIIGTILKLYGTNGANYGAPASIPLSNNQVGLQWSIDTVSQGSAPAPGIFQINATTGELSEVSPGIAAGRYNFKIKLTAQDSTFDFCLFSLTVGETLADGSFSTTNGTASGIVNFNDSIVFSLHNSLTNAFDNITNSSNSFPKIFPSVANAQASPTPMALNGSNYEAVCTSYSVSSTSTDNRLKTIQLPNLNSGAGAGALTQGTGFLRIIGTIPIGYGAFNSYNSIDFSWAIEYRPSPSSAWRPAVDIEGNILSWNGALTSGTTQPNPIQSDQTHVGASANNTNARDTDQNFGCQLTGGIIGTINAPNSNFIRYTGQQASSLNGNSGNTIISKFVAVGESPTYGITPCFGEYRIITQRFGGSCFTCQSCGSGGPKAISSSSFGAFVPIQVEIGDFFYDLGPQRAFAYKVRTSLLTTQQDALNSGSTTINQTVYAREPVHRYVSTFFEDPDLTIPFTGYTGTGTYVAYMASTATGGNFTPPLGNTLPNNTANQKYAEAAEVAAVNAASSTTLQNLRVWSKEVNPTTGTFIAGTGVANKG